MAKIGGGEQQPAQVTKTLRSAAGQRAKQLKHNLGAPCKAHHCQPAIDLQDMAVRQSGPCASTATQLQSLTISASLVKIELPRRGAPLKTAAAQGSEGLKAALSGWLPTCCTTLHGMPWCRTAENHLAIQGMSQGMSQVSWESPGTAVATVNSRKVRAMGTGAMAICSKTFLPAAPNHSSAACPTCLTHGISGKP